MMLVGLDHQYIKGLGHCEHLAKGCEEKGKQQSFHSGESCRVAKRLAIVRHWVSGQTATGQGS